MKARKVMLTLPAFQRNFKSLFISCTGFRNATNYTTTPTSEFQKNPTYYSLDSEFMKHLKTNKINEAHQIFNKIPSPNVYLYTMLFTSYYRKGEINEALRVFNDMPVKDIVSWNSMIKGCLSCGDLDMARKLFDEMPDRNVVSWATIVDGCAQFGEVEMAEELFGKMPRRNIVAWNSMVVGYCSNGRIEDGFELFKRMPIRDDISWNTMICGLGQCGRSEEALFLFQEMCVLGVKLTPITYSSVLTACANISALCCGVQLHALVVKIGYAFDTFISVSLITFYAHCMLVDNSLKVFEDNLVANVVMWMALINGYGLNSKHEEALEVFYGMIMSGTMPNQSTFTSALNSCSELDALDRGKGLHTRTIKLGLDVDVFVGNSLIVMYTECGCVGDGITIFNNMSKRNLVSWNSIIVGCAQNGHGTLSLELFDQMINAEVPPDEITYVGLLTACSHSRMLDKGKYFFEQLNRDPSVEVNLEHYACMVDILGRSGRLEEAEEFILRMPVKANLTVWMAVLSACNVHSNLDVATRAAHRVMDIEPHNSAGYVLLSNLYASASRWNEVSHIRILMKEKGFVKQTGSSWLTLNGARHPRQLDSYAEKNTKEGEVPARLQLV